MEKQLDEILPIVSSGEKRSKIWFWVNVGPKTGHPGCMNGGTERQLNHKLMVEYT